MRVVITEPGVVINCSDFHSFLYPLYQPENILCVSMDSNEIKLVDFGLARNLNSEEDVKSSFGTPDFVGKVISFSFVYIPKQGDESH